MSGSWYGGLGQGVQNLVSSLPTNLQSYIGGPAYRGMTANQISGYGNTGAYNTLAQDMAQNRIGPFGFMSYGNPFSYQQAAPMPNYPMWNSGYGSGYGGYGGYGGWGSRPVNDMAYPMYAQPQNPAAPMRWQAPSYQPFSYQQSPYGVPGRGWNGVGNISDMPGFD